MKKRYFITAVSLAMASLLLSIPSYSQDKDLLARADSLLQQGRNLFASKKYEDAIILFEQAAEIRKEQLGDYSAGLADILHNVGLCYWYLGDYVRALENFLPEQTIRENILSKDHPDYASSLNSIGTCYYNLGDFTKALEYIQSALTIREQFLGKDHPDYANSLNNIGMCYSNLGNFTKALECFLSALTIREQILGMDHPYYAYSLNNIGMCYSDLGNFTKALECYQQVLSLYEKIYGKLHPEYARTLGNVGICYKNLNEFNKAIQYHQQSLLIIERTLGKENDIYYRDLLYLGECYLCMGSFSTALTNFQQALGIEERVYGKEHPDYAIILKDIGCCYYNLTDYTLASYYFEQYINTVALIVKSSFSTLTESMRESFWSAFSDFFTNTLYRYCAQLSTPVIKISAYNGTLLGKGLLLNAETEMRELILESGDEEALRMYNNIQVSRLKLDRLYEDPVGKKEAIDSLNNDIEKRQQDLMKLSKAFGDYTRNLALKWTDVQASLGKKDIAIEFETYTYQDTTFYIALTLRPGYTEPHLVELFNSKDLAQISSKQYYTTTSMTDLVWGNLSDELNGVKNVYFSPAGELNNIGIEYLLDTDGKHLISDKRNYYRLTSTRELVKEHSGKKMTDATVYGGIRYDISPRSNLTGDETESERLALTATRSWMPMDSLSVTRGGWVYLPGTKEEAEAISTTLSSKKVQNNLLEGENGTEESFKALSGAKKDVIHIATHGFYWTETEAARSGMETSSFMLDGESRAPKEDKALTRSGLLFAGAQNAFDGKEIPIDVEDGILTAKDISRMDLRGTDLVVISACQSGLGEVTGDGVFGLQRGFKKAGVQSIVMSLWEVDDTATKIMMTRFYENLAKGKSKYDSFREAQNYLRKYGGGLYDEPEYYAAFVLLDAIK